MKFDKVAYTNDQHYELLLERGLEIPDKARFYKYLKYVGYYRLTGYLYPFQNSDGSHKFKENTNFDIIIKHYIFDKKLRLLVLDYIERIEVSLRAIFCNTMCLQYGPNWYTDANLFNNQNIHSDWVESIRNYVNEANEEFIKNYVLKYSESKDPPFWMIVETLTFGSLASMYENMSDVQEKKDIAELFGIQTTILVSWLKSINLARNICAHHSRLWNRKLPLKPIIPHRQKYRVLENINEDTNKRLYGTLSCILFMSKKLIPGTNFGNKLKTLFEEYPEINIGYMGFPANFREEPLWND